MFTDLAKTSDPDDAFQDKLVSLLLWTREFDGLYKRLQGIEGPITAGSRMALVVSCKRRCRHRAARGEVPSGVLLFQSPLRRCLPRLSRPNCPLAPPRGPRNHRRRKNLIAPPAAIIWLENARHSLFVFSAINGSYEDSPQATAGHSSPGALAQVAGVEDHGLALERWLFWRRRLQQLSRSSDTDLAKQAKKGFMSMIFCGRDLGFEVEGEAKFSERLQKAMHEELMRSGKNSVDGDEIEIDVDWAN
ncbi:LOW QUALITY PROTEIN: hypothetical protein Ct61P_07187 [Colletotrichum tofieldiae]|nr:LOW QUALITY PROTEIN: hypothetical protein Ct61P_07187 [Colletotrichum tofieldiae]